MPAKTLLGELELPLAQCIDVEDSHGLVHHAVPALDGDFLQRTGRRAARVAVTGVVAGPEAREGLEGLRGQLRAARPVDFVADVATATRVTRVLVEKLDVRELAGKPERFEYAFLLREYVPPPPRQTEVPPVIPPGPSTDTGVLEVEVVVEGEPDFDMSRVTVTAQGGGAGGPASRTLSERAGNLWTESAAPLGEHTVTATVTEPEMTGANTATVRAGQTTRVRITLVPAQGVARAFSVSFRFDNAFVEPCMRAALRRAASFGRAHPSQKLIVVGHTDKTGSDAYNQSLSERRARAVFACVSFQEAPAAAVAEWTALRRARTGDPVRTVQDRWGAREYQQMLQQLGDYPGQIDGNHGPTTGEAVRAFRCRKGLPPGTTVDDAVWDALIHDYLADDPPAVPRAQLLPNCASTKLEWLGCGEQDPVNNTEAAHRPNRRVELLFTTSTTLPAQAPVPDTWTLPPPGRTDAEWCLGPGDPARRCAFSKRTPPPEPPRLLIQPAEPGTVEAAGRILREVERADGTVEQLPAANESFVLITAAGEYRAGEAGSGLPTPARTDASGGFSFPGKPRGLYALEIQRGVIARLLDAPGAAALGPTVCKALAVDGARLDVLILRDPVLREIRLPVIVHLMTALHPTTRVVRTCLDESSATPTTHLQRTARDEAAVRTMLTGANAIWGRARVRFEVRDVVREAFATPGRDACHVTDAERNNVVVDAATPNAVNLFFFGSVDVLKEGGVTLRGGLMDGAGTQVRELVAISIADVVLRQVLPPIPPSRHVPTAREAEVILAHELGHWLSLDHETGSDSAPANRNRLMLPELGEEHRRLLDTEVTQARGSSDAAKECVPLALRVAGAVRYGGPHGHRFIAIRDAAAPAITVDAVLPDHLAASGLTMTGGAPGASPTQRTVGRGTGGRTEVIAKLAAAGGRPMETYAAVQVVDFDVTVDGARRLGGAGGTTFVAVRAATGTVTVRADVTPAPDVVPFDMVTWSAGDETDDPLRRTLSLATAGTTTVSVTVAGVTKTVTIQVSELALNVTGAERTGPDQFAAVRDDTGDVSVEAVFTPPVSEDAGLVDWTGGQPGPGPRFRLVSKQAIEVTTVTARVGAPPPAAAPAPAGPQAGTGQGAEPPLADPARSATITVFDFTLDVPGATRLDGPTGTRFVAFPDAADLTVVATITPPGILPGVVTWTGAQEIPGMQPPQALVRRSTRRTVTVSAEMATETRSIEIFIVSFRLDVAGLTPLATPGGNDFLVLVDAAANVEVNAVLDPPIPNPPADLVTWTSSDNTAVAGSGPLQRLVPRTPKRSLTVTGTVAGQAETVQLFISELTLGVTGAQEIPPAGSTEFMALAATGQTATVTATLDPAPNPVPNGLVVWGGDATTPDGPTARRIPLDTARPAVRVEATVAGVTRSVRVNIVTFTLDVTGGATAVPADGTTFFVAQQAGARVTVEARIAPLPVTALPPDFVAWTGGDEVAGNPLQRTVDRGTTAVTPVTATSALLGGAARSVTLHVFSATLTVQAPAVAFGPAGGGNFLAVQDPAPLTAEVVITPAPTPLPAGLVVWTGATPLAGNDLRAAVPRAAAGPPVQVQATVAGVPQSVTLHVVTFTLGVRAPAVAIGAAGGGNFLALEDPSPLTTEVVITPTPNPVPQGLVAWSGATPVAGNDLLATVPRAAAGPPVQVQATLAGVAQVVTLHVVTFALEVDDATPLPAAGTDFFALQGAGNVTVRAVFTPLPAISLPDELVSWTGGEEVPGNPRARRVPRAAAGPPVTVRAQALGGTRSVIVHVVSFALSVQGAVQIGARSSTTFAATTGPGNVTVTGTLTPAVNPVPAGLVTWTGGAAVPGNPLAVTVSRGAAARTPVTATVLGTSFPVTVAVLADPSTPGSFLVGEEDFNPGSTMTVTVGLTSFTVRHKALVRYPADAAGVGAPVAAARPSYPLVFILHGNHRRFDDLGNFVESFRGHEPLARHLATHGYIAVSIDGDDINGRPRPLGGLIPQRGQLIREHIGLMVGRNVGDPIFGGKIDTATIGLIGHSRGAEAVVAAQVQNVTGTLGLGIKGVVSIAPTDFDSFSLTGAPYLVLYGTSDGDVDGDPDGGPFVVYERAAAPKAMWFAYGACHNRFSTNLDWNDATHLDNDDARLLSQAQHQDIAKGFCMAFLERHLRADTPFDLFFAHDQRPASVAGVEMFPQYRDATTQGVDDFEQPPPNPAAPLPEQLKERAKQNSLTRAVTATGLALPGPMLPPAPTAFADALTEAPLTRDRLEFFVHLGNGLLAAWTTTTGVYDSDLGTLDASAFQVLSFRVTQRNGSPRNTPGAAQDFFVALVDTANRTAELRVGATAVIPAPFVRHDHLALHPFVPPAATFADARPDSPALSKSAMRTVRLRLDDFKTVTPLLDLAALKTIRFAFRQTASGEVAIDDLEFSL